jgi:murein DD-endopeptidase MepM/ murein hydrolase activator NlpD
MKLNLLLVSLVLLSMSAFSQFFPSRDYPKGYFRDPLGIPIHLAANFGELRANHFHMGLDIRTEKKENLPVYAAAAGYVTRVKIEPFGFGKAIYIRHPNGYTTLYAHLNEFYPGLAAYVDSEQYKREHWQMDLEIPPGLFPVAKGALIAWSGNTGGSQGPHLHFEIRHSGDDLNLNPLLFGLPVPDHVPPVIKALAIYDAGTSIYEQSPRIIPVKRTGQGFGLTEGTIETGSPRVRIAIGASDSQSGSSNPNGIYEADLLVDGSPLIGFQADRISYTYTRNVNAHIDYKTRALGGPWLQQLFVLPGLFNSVYGPPGVNGNIDLRDGAIHEIRIVVKDAYANISKLRFSIQYSPKGTVASAAAGKLFYPQMLDGVESDDLAFYMGEKCLYDSVHLSYSSNGPALPGAVSRSFSIGADYIPLQDSFLVRIRPVAALDSQQSEKVVMQCVSGDRKEVRKVSWHGGWASARFMEFGNFQLLLDEVPPSIEPIGFRDGAVMGPNSMIVFLVKDNLESVKNFRAELDGQWLCFSNDKARAFIYKMDAHCGPGHHRLVVTAEDEAGNRSSRSFEFTR